MKNISEELGFVQLSTESVSSKVFIKDGYIFKLNNRNSINRAITDFESLKFNLKDFQDHIPHTEIYEVVFRDQVYTCVSQPCIDGKELKKLERDELSAALRNNKEFLSKLLEYFFSAIEKQELYPDIVGYPADPEYFNSINLMLEIESGRIVLCDVGLSPHEDTLAKNGIDFYASENVKVYVEKMKRFKEVLESL